MARDNSPHKRQSKQLERKQNRRAWYNRILIVSEGSKTEPNYFYEICKFYHLHTANVVVRPSELGTSPIQVVRYAKELFQQGDLHRNIRPRTFDQVYAVFDRDNHKNYYDALDFAKSLDRKLKNDAKQQVSFKAIPSIPSFELWLLLHYEDIQAPIDNKEVIQRLRKPANFPTYKKGEAYAFKYTRERLSIAIARAKTLATKFTPYDEPNPYTSIVDIVEVLIKLTSQ